MPDIYLNNLDGIPFGDNAGRPTPQTGQPYFNGEENRLELYSAAVGWSNIVQETPSVVSVVGQLNENTPSTFVINGTNFAAGAIAYIVGTNGIETAATSTTLDSVVQITATFPAASPAYAPYDVKIVNPSNLYGVLYETLTVNDAPVWSIGAGSLGSFTELQAMSVSVGGATDTSDSTNSPLSYSVSSGSLPGGLTLNSSTGVISGTPSNVIPNTTYTFDISVTDGRNLTQTKSFSITINDRGPVWSTTSPLPTFTRNSAYSTTLVATDDDGIASYTLFSGSLPAGLSLGTSTGVISGTPTASTASVFTIRVTDNGGNYSDRQFTMPNAGPAWSTTSPLPTFSKNSAYSTTVVATDDSGNTPAYSLVSGSLPTGLTLNTSSGLISGTPTGDTTATFTLRATDSNGSIADRSFTIPNAGPSWVTAAGALTSSVTGLSYSVSVVATDDSGNAPAYSLASGSLPTGLTLSAAGVISGTPTVAANSSFTIRATDVNGNTADRAFSINIAPALYVPSASSFTLTSPGETNLTSNLSGLYNSMVNNQSVILQFDVYGAGGGSGGVDTMSTYSGGSGGRGTVKYTLPRNILQQLVGVVGQGGAGGASSGTDVTNYNYSISVGGAGYATNKSGGGAGGDGGGFSGIFLNSSVSFANALAIAGGGGGSAGSDDSRTPGQAGAGGGFDQNGGSGTCGGNASDNQCSVAGGGAGGTTSSGGATGTSEAAGSSQPGRQLLGGYGVNDTGATSMGGGGGGGGGYYGGGGGGSPSGNGSGGGGGGGSGYTLNAYSRNILLQSTGGGAAGASPNGSAGSNGSITVSWGYAN